MDFIEKRDQNRPTTGDAPFCLGETFFSRTDKRGIVLAGNDIFRRVSGYSWDEIVGSPHSTIRHPDMPKGFFKYFWDTLKQNQPVTGYIKSLSKDGLCYWVLAIIMPTNDGYLSVRVKPSSNVLLKIEAIYAEMLLEETQNNITLDQSVELMIKRIKELGLPNYSCFAAHALEHEILSMDEKLGKAADRTVSGFMNIMPEIKELKIKTDQLVSFFDTVSEIPTNLRILASRIEPSGGPLSSLSENYWKMSDDMTRWFMGFVSSSGNAFASIEIAINDAMVLRCATRLLNESADQFSKERRRLGGLDAVAERKVISDLAKAYERKSREGLAVVERESDAISTALNILRRHILGLSTTRVMCKIESASLTEEADNLTAIIEKFESFQATVDDVLEGIDDSNAIIKSNSRALQAIK